MTHEISHKELSIIDIENIINNDIKISISKKAKNTIKNCRTYLDNKLNQSEELFYGINTGFGSLCNVRINHQDTVQLQRNLVISHACGMGDEIPQKIVKLILLLKIQSLSYGNSGVRLELVERLVDFYNHDILPVIYEQGSLGASGDLAPLAHLSLALLGEGEVYYQNKKQEAKEIHKKLGWSPLELESKEGIALLNGTQFSLAFSLWSTIQAKHISKLSDKIAALSIDAFDCRISPFDKRIHLIRPHQGQIQTAENISNLLEGSQIITQEKNHVQDPYAFRCVPQVHGATKSTIDHVEKVVTIELNSVTDNPNIFPEDDMIISGGNFHAQHLALASDFLAIAIAELGNISERRTYQLISGQRNLPAFLTPAPGLNSGFMISQYTAASIVSQNKQLCTPASVDSIVSCNGQEDHVSMAANAGTKLYKVIENVKSLLAIELMCATQAIEFRRPLKTSPILETFLKEYRNINPSLENDRILYKDMHKTKQFLDNYFKI